MSGSLPKSPGYSSNSESPFYDEDFLMSPDTLAAQSIPSGFPHMPDKPDKQQFALLLINSYITKLVDVVRFGDRRTRQRFFDRWRYSLMGSN
jgi:hypothetical protein